MPYRAIDVFVAKLPEPTVIVIVLTAEVLTHKPEVKEISEFEPLVSIPPMALIVLFFVVEA